RHDLLPIGERQLDRRLADGDAGAVDEHIDAAMALDEISKGTIDRGFVGDIEGLCIGATPRRRDLCRDFGGSDGVDIEHGDARADAGERQRRGAADTARTAGDRRHFAVKAEGGEGVGEIEAAAHSITSLKGRKATTAPGSSRLTPSPISTSPSDSTIDVRIPAPSRGNFWATQPPSAPRSSRARTNSQRLLRFL